jgi:hypothetical protein
MIAARPLTIAEIFDHAVPIFVRRWPIVVFVVVIAETPDALIIALTRGHVTQGAAAIQLVTDVLAGAFAYSALVHLGAEGDAAPNQLGAVLRRALADFGRSLASFVLVYAVLFAFFAIVIVIVGLAALAARFTVGAIAALVVAIVLGLLACVPALLLFVILTVAYANVILEGVNPWRGLVSAAARVRRDRLARALLLGAALLLVTAFPILSIDAALRPLSQVPGMWWVLLPEPYAANGTGVAFATVASAVAAVDYRNRSEGADLEADLDAPATAT